MKRDVDPVDLLATVPPRPDLPPAELDAIKSAAREVWRAKYGRRRRWWLVPLAAALAGCALLFWWNARPVEAPFESPRVAESLGGLDEREIHLPGGASLWLEGGTQATLVFPNVVRLDRGTVFVSTHGSQDVTIRTAAGDFRPAGTRFEVRVARETALRVLEGRVAFRESLVSAGESLVVRDGTVLRVPSAMPPIEGETLLSFLEILARDQRWTLRFSDSQAIATCRKTVLHGSVEKLSPVDALQTVTLSAGVRYELANRILTISESSR